MTRSRRSCRNIGTSISNAVPAGTTKTGLEQESCSAQSVKSRACSTPVFRTRFQARPMKDRPPTPNGRHRHELFIKTSFYGTLLH